MKRTFSHFKGRELERVFVANSARAGEQVDKILGSAPFDYLLGIGLASLSNDWSKSTASFWVLPEDAADCRALFVSSGITEGIDAEGQRLKV